LTLHKEIFFNCISYVAHSARKICSGDDDDDDDDDDGGGGGGGDDGDGEVVVIVMVDDTNWKRYGSSHSLF
jgi:hypothetical protein